MRLFTASWCKPCTELKEWLAENGIDVPIVDIDEEFEEAQRVGIKKVPTLALDNNVIIVGNENIRPFLESSNAS